MISFSSITQSQYDELASYVQDRIYFITDSGKLMLNGNEYGGGGGSEPVNPAFAPIEVKAAAGDCVYDLDFSGAKIQKFDMASATAGSNSIEIVFANLSGVPSGQTATYELQIPVTETDVETINLPAGAVALEMPETLEATSGKIAYHDIVFRAEKDVNNEVVVYASYAYKFDEAVDYLTFTAETAGSTVSLLLQGAATERNVEWSTDGDSWTPFTWANGATDAVTLANVGDSVMIRCNDGQFSTGDSDWVQFVFTGTIAASGNVMTLLSYTGTDSAVPAYAFLNLFRDQTALVEAPELPALNLNYKSYFCMFYGCSLANAPKLTAEQYAYQCYGSMFGGGHHAFTSIEIVGQWDALGSDTSAMEKMFKGCSALNSVTVHWTNWPSNGGTTNWLQNVAVTGTFHCPAALTIPSRDASGVPANWTIVNDVTA